MAGSELNSNLLLFSLYVVLFCLFVCFFWGGGVEVLLVLLVLLGIA